MRVKSTTRSRTGKKPKSSASEKMRRYRARLRAAGLRPVQIWVYDTSAPGFAAEARRQSLLVSRSPENKEAQDFIDAVVAADIASWDGWE